MKKFLNKAFVLKSERETLSLAEAFSKTIKRGQIVLLTGDLGAGKTTFTKGFVKGLKIDENVVSPTFTILNNYGDKVNHVDLYRLSGENEFEATGVLEEIYTDKISLIEWPEIVGFKFFNKDAIVVKIEKLDENTRKITFEGNE